MMSKITVKPINFTQDSEHYLQIWEQCFPNESDFAKKFLTALGDKTGLAVFEDRHPVSMAFFLPSALHLPSAMFSARYIYAVATLPTHRRKGYAARLLSEGTRRFPADLFYLHPAEPHLKAFYGRLGYRSCLFTDTFTFGEDTDGCENTGSCTEIPFDPVEYLAYRKAFFADKPVAFSAFPPTVLSIMSENVSLLKFSDGLAVLEKSADTCYLPETVANPDKISAFCHTVKRQYPQKRLQVHFPGNAEAVGMVLPLSEPAKQELTETTLPFSGLLFDR